MDTIIASIGVSYLSPQEIVDLHNAIGVEVSAETVDLSYVPSWGDYVEPYNKKVLREIIVPNLNHLSELRQFRNLNRIFMDIEHSDIFPRPYRVDYSALQHLSIRELDASTAIPSASDLGDVSRFTVLKIDGYNLTNADLIKFTHLTTLDLILFGEELDTAALPRSLRHLELADITVTNTEGLRGLQLHNLWLNEHLPDITVLARMPLQRLVLIVTPIDLTFISQLHTLVELNISNSSLRDADIIPLQSLQLKILIASNNEFSVVGFRTLLRLPLRELDLHRNRNIGLSAVHDSYSIRSSTLTTLDLILCQLPPRFLERLDMPVLESLFVSMDRELYIQHAPAVRTLRAQHCTILDPEYLPTKLVELILMNNTNPALFYDWNFVDLRKLDVSYCNLSDITFMRSLHLDELIMSFNPVTDISPLRHMKLRKLWMQRTRVSDDQLVNVIQMPLEDLRTTIFTGVGIQYLTQLPLKVLVFDQDTFNDEHRDQLGTLPSYLYQHNLRRVD